jgi:hypothetical protein
MAQFDVVSYSSQVFWFTLFFFAGYYVVVRFVLPAIYSSLRVREWRLSVLEQEIRHNENVLMFWTFLVMGRFYAGSSLISFEYVRSIIERKNLFNDFAKFSMFEPYLRSVQGTDSALYMDKTADVVCRQRMLTSIFLK